MKELIKNNQDLTNTVKVNRVARKNSQDETNEYSKLVLLALKQLRINHKKTKRLIKEIFDKLKINVSYYIDSRSYY